MSSTTPTENTLRAEIADLRARLEETEETLRAIRCGEVDALVVESAAGPQLFVLQSTDAGANRFRSDILEKVSEAIVALDENRHVIYLNAAAERQYGVLTSEALGRSLTDVYENRWLAPEDEEHALTALRETGHWLGRSIHVKRSGEEIFVETSVSRMLGKDGVPSGLLGVVRDITEQRLAEEGIRQNEALFSSLIAQAPGGVYVVDAEFRVLQVSAGARPTFASVEPVIGRDFDEVMKTLWGPEVGPELVEIFRHTLATGERYVSPRFTQTRQDLGEEKSYEWETQRIAMPAGGHGVACYFSDVTESERAAMALRESENFNRSIVESSMDCMKVLDLEGLLLSMSPHGQRLLGIVDIKRYIGMSWIDFWKGEHREAAQAAVAAAGAGGNGSMVGLSVTPAGEAKWFDVAISPIGDASGVPVRLLAVSRDITARRRAELDGSFLASASEDLSNLSTVSEIMETILARLGAHLGLSLVNFVDICEAGNEAVVSYAWHRPDVPSSIGSYQLSEYLTPDFQKTLRDGKPFIVRDTGADSRADASRYETLKMGAFVCMPLTRDGQCRFLLNIHHSEPHDWQPEEIELARELSTRVWTRLERVRIESALHESEARFRMMADAINQLAWIARADGHIYWYNQRWYDYTGTTPEEMEGWGWEKVHHPEELPGVVERWKKSIDTGEPFDMTFPLRGADGIFRDFLTRVIPMKGDDGRVLQWFGTNTDVSELKRIETALADRVADLAEADRSKDEFLAMLAHELRNPLAPLRNAAEILQTRGSTAGEQEQAQRIIGRQIENMSRMIDDLLDVSRITKGKIELRKTPVALEAILTAAVSLARSGCAARKQDLALSLPPAPVWLDADATRLEQVFGNLLTNACKYGGEGCHIAVQTELADREVIVRVQDDGAGIAPELLPRIFDLFVQSSRTLDRAHGGLGIGLTLVKRLVKMHEGSIEARSEGLGHGSEFIIRLPVVDKAPPPAPLPPPPVAQAASRRILIVDDNTDSARSLATLQSRRGHHTRTAFTGPEALAAAAEFLPEVVLLDIGLPGMDGYEVARQIRATPALADTFLIAMTGYASAEDRAQSCEAGFDAHLVKPIDLETLRTLLATRPRVLARR